MDVVFNRLNALDWPESVARPVFADYDVVAVTEANMGQLATMGIRVGGRGLGNIVLLGRGFTPLARPLSLSFQGSDNICLIEENSAVQGAIDCHTNCIAVILGGQHALSLGVNLYHGGQIFWGRAARTYGCRIWTHGGKRVIVGDDCLFSEGISIRTSDHHSIIDLDDGSQLNHPADVVIGRHVWVSPEVKIMPGVRIGTGAIIGIGAVVTKDVPAAEMWAGVPARCLRQNVSWVDSHPAAPGQVEDMYCLLGRTW